MRAWATGPDPGSVHPVERPVPTPARGELLVKVLACGLCRTDLHVVDRELPVHRAGVVPGHQVVGIFTELGDGVRNVAIGDTVGIAWLRETCGRSEERRVGKGGVSTGRSRWAPYA